MTRSCAVFLLTCLVGLHTPALLAQVGADTLRISGIVRDPLGQPIQGAELRVVGKPLTTLSGDSGGFRLVVPKALPVLIQVRRPGYRAILLNFEASWNGSIVLEPGVFELPPLEVNATMAKPSRYADTHKYDGYFDRRRLGFGDFITREQLDARSALHTSQLLEGRAGIRVDYRQGETATGSPATIISFARCNEFPPKINVYVDGHKLQPRMELATFAGGGTLDFLRRGASENELQKRREIRGMIGEMLERINPSDIELMEIYRGPGELPAAFHDGNCAAIVIWTRLGPR